MTAYGYEIVSACAFIKEAGGGFIEPATLARLAKQGDGPARTIHDGVAVYSREELIAFAGIRAAMLRQRRHARKSQQKMLRESING